MRKVVRLTFEVVGVPIAITYLSYVLIALLFWQQHPGLWQFVQRYAIASMGGSFLSYALWCEEAHKREASGGSVNEMLGWALLGCLFLGLVIFVCTLAPVFCSWCRAVSALSVFGQQVCLLLAWGASASIFERSQP